jgi:hypothetical protein
LLATTVFKIIVLMEVKKGNEKNRSRSWIVLTGGFHMYTYSNKEYVS